MIPLWFWFVFGIVWAALGEHLGWSKVKVYATGIIICIAVTLLTYPAEASADAHSKLKAANAKLMNGSGFIFKSSSGKTYLVTNYHVCLASSWHDTLAGSLESGEVVRGPIVKREIQPDLCAAKVSNWDLAPLVQAKDLKKLEPVYTRGYPYSTLSESAGHFIGIVRWQHTFDISDIGECPKGTTKERSGEGLVIGCSIDYVDNVTDLYARPGASGSAVVNGDGDLVGVISSWDSGRDAGGMVPLQDIQEFFKGL